MCQSRQSPEVSHADRANKQVELVKHVRQAGPSRQLKQASLSWATTDKLNGKRNKTALSNHLMSRRNDP